MAIRSIVAQVYAEYVPNLPAWSLHRGIDNCAVFLPEADRVGGRVVGFRWWAMPCCSIDLGGQDVPTDD